MEALLTEGFAGTNIHDNCIEGQTSLTLAVNCTAWSPRKVLVDLLPARQLTRPEREGMG